MKFVADLCLYNESGLIEFIGDKQGCDLEKNKRGSSKVSVIRCLKGEEQE